jgi:hypothetical protein
LNKFNWDLRIYFKVLLFQELRVRSPYYGPQVITNGEKRQKHQETATPVRDKRHVSWSNSIYAFEKRSFRTTEEKEQVEQIFDL